MAEIALCLSGGGYRAAVFHLGVMTYLNDVRFLDGSRILDHVHTITCISGGALPGLTYMVGEAKGKDRRTVFSDLFHKLRDQKLAEKLLNKYDTNAQQGIGLIEVLADVYDEIFFNDERFGTIMEFVNWNGIHHFAADATDFELGKPFRFQATPRINDENRDEEYGVIGTRRHKINRRDAAKIRLADIMASTSCFPLVFEPIVYPENFKFPNGFILSGDQEISFLLMDGGLVDNQGIDPALHAEKHMIFEGRMIDIALLSDAGNVSESSNDDDVPKWRISPKRLFYYIISSGIILMVCSIVSWYRDLLFFSGLSLSLGLVAFILCLVLFYSNQYVLGKISEKIKFPVKNKFIWNSSLENIYTFIKSRIGTAYRMVNIIMMGHIRQNALHSLFGDSQWNKKVILNTLPVLTKSDQWKRIWNKAGASRDLVPSKKIQRNSYKAAKTETTLWFTEKELMDNIPLCILACGQYTVCWNLLIYIAKIKERIENGENVELTEGQQKLIALEPVLMGDWRRFNARPLIKAEQYK